MNKDILKKIATKLSQPPKGILAADESTNTIKKRFNNIQLESTFENRRKYRELLFKTPKISDSISGIIMYDETIRQKTSEGVLFTDFLYQNDIIPGIKVDTGAISLSENSTEKITEGIDGLKERLTEYKSFGAKFTKWRAIIAIGDSIPSDYCIEVNSFNLARYSKIVQESGLVPIVEPEVLMDGKHSIDDCYDITKKVLLNVFSQLSKHEVFLEGILLKPNMILSGNLSEQQVSVQEVAKMTLKCLTASVPPQVPGIVFLSGGQSNELATEHLNEMNKISTASWNISFSYGRALQQPAISKWKGMDQNVKISQDALYNRGILNSKATIGEYSRDLEINS